MKLNKTEITEKNKVRINSFVYYPDKYFFIYRLFLEKILFPLFKNKETRYLIVTKSNKVPRLGLQQVIKISAFDSKKDIEKLIEQRIYLQNNYLRYPPREVNFTGPILSMFFFIVFIAGSIYLVQTNCFPSPEKYFFPKIKMCQIFKNKIVFGILVNSYVPEWKTYQQELLLRKDLISKISGNKNNLEYEYDWLYSRHVLDHPVYVDYLHSLKNQGWEINLLSEPLPVYAINSIFTLSKNNLSGNYELKFTDPPAAPIVIKLPVGTQVVKIYKDETTLNSNLYWVDENRLHLDLTNIPNQKFSLNIFFNVLYGDFLKKSFKLNFDLPVGQTLQEHTLVINYPPWIQVNVTNTPLIAHPGYLKYNLALQGLTVVEFSADFYE